VGLKSTTYKFPNDMDIKELTKRAIEIRGKLAVLEQKKHGRAWTRSEIAQGFVSDVGDFMKLVMAKDGLRDIENIDNELKYELADCLWSILILAKEYDIDIEDAFVGTMDHLEKKIAAKINAAKK